MFKLDHADMTRTTRPLAAWTFAALFVLLLWDFSGVDMAVAHLAGDAANSPISISDNYATALSFVGYRF